MFYILTYDVTSQTIPFYIIIFSHSNFSQQKNSTTHFSNFSFYLHILSIIIVVFAKILMVIKMTEIEKSYIAGIIDGEGSIMLQKFHNNQFPAPYVSIPSTTLELLEWIQVAVGKGSIKATKNYNLDRHKNSYTYFLKYDAAIELLKSVYPYLVIYSKKKRANLIITRYKEVTPRNGRYSEDLLKEKNDFYKEFMSIK